MRIQMQRNDRGVTIHLCCHPKTIEGLYTILSILDYFMFWVLMGLDFHHSEHQCLIIGTFVYYKFLLITNDTLETYGEKRTVDVAADKRVPNSSDRVVLVGMTMVGTCNGLNTQPSRRIPQLAMILSSWQSTYDLHNIFDVMTILDKRGQSLQFIFNV